MSAPDFSPPPPGYRAGVGVMLFNRQGLILVASRRDAPDAWQMPQGGIDSGEDPRHAALRELEEEIGTANAEIVAEAAGWLAYDLPPELAARIWGGRFRGQAQKWYAARFLGRDAEIDLGRHAHPEFSAWKWSPIDALPALIIDFKRPLYTRLVVELGPRIKAETRR